MGYEPELNDPVFYEEEKEREIKCFLCSEPLDQDDIVWADCEGQWQVRGKEGNDTCRDLALIQIQEEETEKEAGMNLMRMTYALSMVDAYAEGKGENE
jgi:hypothetical protein